MHGQTTFLHTLPYTIVGQLIESQSPELCAAPELCQMVGQACRMTSILVVVSSKSRAREWDP